MGINSGEPLWAKKAAYVHAQNRPIQKLFLIIIF